jgi:hypothetical protein
MREFDDEPPCCVNGVTPECDSCAGFDGNCAAYRAALKEIDAREYRFRVDFAKEIAKAKKKG